MAIPSLDNNLVIFDRALDYIPVVSSLKNLIQIFQKTVFLSQMQSQSISASRYYTYLSQKSFNRYFMLLVPFVGNIIVAICDFTKSRRVRKNPSYAVEQDKNVHQPASEALKGDRKIVLAAVQQVCLCSNNNINSMRNSFLFSDAEEQWPAIEEVFYSFLSFKELLVGIKLGAPKIENKFVDNSLTRFRNHKLYDSNVLGPVLRALLAPRQVPFMVM